MKFHDLPKIKILGTKTSIKTLFYAALGTLIGFYLAGAFKNVENFIFGIIGGGAAFLLFGAGVETAIDNIVSESSKSFYESKKKRCADPSTRLTCYVLCICVLFTVTAFCVAIVSASREPGDVEEATGKVVTEYIPETPLKKQIEWKENMFLALIVPSLIGVRIALGDKPNEEN